MIFPVNVFKKTLNTRKLMASDKTSTSFYNRQCTIIHSLTSCIYCNIRIEHYLGCDSPSGALYCSWGYYFSILYFS